MGETNTMYSKMEFIVFFHVFTTWNACCFVIRFPSCRLINIFQNRISCFLSQFYPAILTWTLHFPVWTTKLEMFRRGLPCWFCVVKRHESKISRCLFFGISKCHANINKIHVQMGYKNTIVQRKRNTWHSISIYRCGWRTGP